MVISVLAPTNFVLVTIMIVLNVNLMYYLLVKNRNFRDVRMCSMDSDMGKPVVWVCVGGRHSSVWALARSE